MKFVMGECYTRRQISAALGGNIQSFLPRAKGAVVCGCFRPEPRWNPGAPEEVVFGAGEHVMRDAKLVAQQSDPIPVFLYRRQGAWEYVGRYICRGLSTDPATLRSAEESNPARGALTGVLHFAAAT